MADIPYGKIVRRTWRKANFRGLAFESKVILAYIWTGPQGETSPIMHLFSVGLMAEDLNMTIERATDLFHELLKSGWFEYDAESRVIYLPKQIVFDPPESPNAVKWMISRVLQQPDNCLLSKFAALIQPLCSEYKVDLHPTLHKTLPEGYYKALPKPYHKGCPTPMQLPMHMQLHKQSAEKPDLNGPAAAGSLPSASKQEEFDRYFSAEENEAPLLEMAGKFGITREDFEVQLGSISDWIGNPANAAKVARIKPARFKQIIWDWLVREYGPPKGA